MRKLVRKILKGASLTTALFIFEACYGTPGDIRPMEGYTFSVVSKDDLSPIPGVEIYSKPFKSDFLDWDFCRKTNDEGMATVHVDVSEGQYPQFRFSGNEDIFEPKDTVILKNADVIEIRLSKKAE